jgi:hypothetical protein
MKRLIAILMICMLMLSAASALSESGELPPDEVFEAAKAAVVQMSKKEFSAAVETLDLKGRLSKDALKRIVDENCRRIYNLNVQSEYSVCWRQDGKIYLAVPLEEPTDGFIDTAVFTLSEKFEFTALEFDLWSFAMDGCAYAKNVKWHVEYVPNYFVIVD